MENEKATAPTQSTVISISLPIDLAERLRFAARENDQTVSQLVRAAVKAHLGGDNAKNK